MRVSVVALALAAIGGAAAPGPPAASAPAGGEPVRLAQAAAPAPAPAPGAGLSARSFTIRYRDPGDAALLIQPALSEAGSYTLQPRLRTLVVQDTEEALGRIAALIRSFDVPPRNVEVTVNLLMGSREPAGSQPIGREVRGITEVLPDITKWTNYRLLDTVSITGSEGAVTSRTLAGEEGEADAYRVVLGITSVDEERGLIVVDPFMVQKEYRAGDRPPVWRPVYSTKLNLRTGRMLTIGATRNEKSEKALFLTIRARVAD